MESGESPHDAVIREVKEETGLNVEVTKFVGVYSKPLEDDVVLLFICHKTGGNLTLNDEADQLEYYSVENIPANRNERHVGRIKDALNMSGETYFRIQR